MKISDSKVDLPYVKGTDTIGDAIDRLKATGKSGVVVDMDKLRFVVLEDQSLRNSLISSSRDVQVGKVAGLAFLMPERTGLSLFSSPRSVTGLAQEQRNYAVTGLKGDFATVLTDSDRAERLNRTSTLFGDDPVIA